MNIKKIDTSDIPEITDFSRAKKNPYYKDLIEKGFSITVHYSPEDAIEIANGIQRRHDDLLELDEEELAALEQYHQNAKLRA